MPIRRFKQIAFHLTGLLFVALAPAAPAQTPPPKDFFLERSKQNSIYYSREEQRDEGYVIGRTLADYTFAFGNAFDSALAALGPNDRWLDVGAGRGQAVLDYYAPNFDFMRPQAAQRKGKKASAVAMSIEDRRTAEWQETAAKLEPGQLRYVYDKRLREYTRNDLGQFQLITDVVGGFSYTENLSVFMNTVLDLLTVNGSFYTLLQDVRVEAGTNKPHYPGAPFLTQLLDATDNDIGVCAWLKQISCVKVTCQTRTDWRPPVEVYRVDKVCEGVNVPPLTATHFVAGTPPERRFRLGAAETTRPPSTITETKP